MKFLFTFLYLTTVVPSFSQTNLKDVLNKSDAYYIAKTGGTIEFEQRYKPASNNDTFNMVSTFTYSLGNGRIAKETYGEAVINFLVDDDAYAFNRNKETYIKAKSGYNYFPGWTTAAFFKPFYKKEKAGRLQSTESVNEFTISYTSGKKTYAIAIDKLTYKVTRRMETTLTENGTSYFEYDFKETGESPGPDSLHAAFEKAIASKRAVSVTEASKEIKDKEEDFKVTLLHSRINIDTLNALAGLHNNTYKQYILLDFFFQACHPCVEAMPELNKLHASMDSNQLKIIGVDNRFDDTANWEKFFALHPISYRIVDGASANSIHKLFPRTINTFPTMILIKPDGNIEAFWIGNKESNMNELKNLLAKATTGD